MAKTVSFWATVTQPQKKKTKKKKTDETKKYARPTLGMCLKVSGVGKRYSPRLPGQRITPSQHPARNFSVIDNID